MDHWWRYASSAFRVLALVLGVALGAAAPIAAGADGASVPADESQIFQEIPTVYTASKYEQKTNQAPAYVSVVTREEIQAHGYRTLAEILRSLPGFFTVDDLNYTYLGVRGFGPPGDENTRILLLIDGHRVNDAIYDMAPIGSDFPLDPDLIDQVEVVRGPSSCLYGSNAFFAVVNVIPRKGRDLGGVELAGTAAGHGLFEGRATYGNRFAGGLSMLISATVAHRRGGDYSFPEFDTPQTPQGEVRGLDGDSFHNAWLTLSYGDFTLESGYVTRLKTVPTAAYGTIFADPRLQTRDQYSTVDLRYDAPPGERVTYGGRLYYDHERYEGCYPYADSLVEPVPPYDYLMRDFGTSDRAGVDLHAETEFASDHRLTSGLEVRHIFRADQGIYDESPYQLLLDDRRALTSWAVYAQDTYTAGRGITIFGGWRYDHDRTVGGAINPRIALIAQADPRTTFKLIYGHSYRAPNFYELYYADGTYQKGNSGLDPETIDSGEANLDRYFGQHLRLGSSVFVYGFDNLIRQAVDPADGMLVFRNEDGVRAWGGEIELEGKRLARFDGHLSYSYQQSWITATHRILCDSPNHLAKLTLNRPLGRGTWLLGGECQYLSRRRTLAGNWDPAQILTNATLRLHLPWPELSATASVFNLFDQTTGDPGSEAFNQDVLPREGRTFQLELVYAR